MTTTLTAETTTPSPTPGAGMVRGLIWRAAVVDLAAVAVVLELPLWVRAPLSVAAMVVVVMYFLRRSRRRGLVDGLLAAVGVGVVLLMLLGIVLNLLPSGIDGTGWGVGVGILELALLLALASWRPPVDARPLRVRRPPIAALVWTALIAAVLTTSLVWSVSSYSSTHVAPLALGMVTSADSSIVTVTSGRDLGPYDLRSVSTTGTVTVLFRDIQVGPDDPASFKIVTPANTRATLQLVKAGGSTSVRELIVDTGTTTSMASR